ncbi:hypothetical protein [Agrobacterium pusense]|uniref:hypothetical protein n=1 Tax=Agrobacterium pusense TaxID=648995 RepID=UPI000513C47E|nr:hypothetical protein [Agrobacterium pusense]ANV25623.1 hypothetical protein BA939_16500 [Rhizobium sp. S41]KGE80205.1 hypothetical protein LW14_24445 [Rhizobium sp. H41]QWW77767.1 FAD-dependent oxidoreductase [Agrobacterium pusense]
MAGSDDYLRNDLNKAVAELRVAEADLASSVREIFVEPGVVMDKLERALARHGKEYVVERLDKNPGTLGKMHGKMLQNQLNNPLKPDDSKRTDRELKHLVPKVATVADARKKVENLQNALYLGDGGPPRGGRDGPSGRG